MPKNRNKVPHLEWLVKLRFGGGKEYTVLRGDTLSKVARQFTGNYQNYMLLAAENNINNPDKINVGQKISIPETFDKPLTLQQIPTKNKVRIIDNYSPNYNYIVEGDKMYYSRKGHNDYWVDISKNNVARKNLYKFLHDKYNFKGYNDNESDIYDQILNGTYVYGLPTNTRNYTQTTVTRNNGTKFNALIPSDVIKKIGNVVHNVHLTNKTINPDSNDIAFETKYDDRDFGGNNTEFIVTPNGVTTSDKYIPYRSYFNGNAPLGLLLKTFKNVYQSINDRATQGLNYVSRLYQKIMLPSESKSSISQYANATSGDWGIIPGSYTGDTINVDKNRYILPESIDLNSLSLGTRNRGDYTPLNTEGAIITNFNPFLRKKDVRYLLSATFIGVDSDGNFKAGPLSSFEDNDLVTKTFRNDVVDFKRDKNGNIMYKSDAVHGNPGRSVPIIITSDGREGSLNILTGKNGDDTYGNITGGRVVLQTDRETRLVSGSIANIESEMNAMKKRAHSKSVRVYTLDNGSYNRGLRTRNKIFTPADLKQYDLLNNGGGNFMYIKGPKKPEYSERFIQTPNIRTTNSESYKKGHGVRNEDKGIVLHHTAFTENNLKPVVSELTNPSTERSSHVIIGYDGNRVSLAKPELVTFHAGESRWDGKNNVNDFMVGVEFLGDTNKKDLTDDQIKSAVEYLTPIIRKYNISLNDIVTHQLVRDAYNQYQKRVGGKQAAGKPDINYKNYVRVINALKLSLYYKK